jgi:hypothetical protein
MLQRRGVNAPMELRELSLNVSTDEFLSAERAFTYADLYVMLGNDETIAWMTPHAAVARCGHGELLDRWYMFGADGNDIKAMAHSPEHMLEICIVVLRLLAVSAVHSVCLRKLRIRHHIALNFAATLANLMEQCQTLKTLALVYMHMDENDCRVLGAYSRPDLEIELFQCKLTNAGTRALAEVLGRNQGPTKLDICNLHHVVLADGLRGNSRLKVLILRISGSRYGGRRKILAIATALRENKGLVEFDLRSTSRRHVMSDETWGAVCESLKTHPTLEVLKIDSALTLGISMGTAARDRAWLKCRIQALSDMMKVNMKIHTIRLHILNSHHELFRGSVIPYLETNRFRPRVRAIQKTRPITYRAKVLGRALLTVRTDANRFWMLLSGNPEVAFTSTTATATTTPAIASLPTFAAATTTAAIVIDIASSRAASASASASAAGATTADLTSTVSHLSLSIYP